MCAPTSSEGSQPRRHARRCFEELRNTIASLDPEVVDEIALSLADARAAGGRVFVVGLGGSAATATHFVADLRRLTRIEAHAPADNVPALTARANDDGWEQAYVACLEELSLRAEDVVVAISVGGGDLARGVSVSLVRSFEAAGEHGCTRVAIVGRGGGELAPMADLAAIVPTVPGERGTFHTESLHLAICHAIVSHPALQVRKTLWEERTEAEAPV